MVRFLLQLASLLLLVSCASNELEAPLVLVPSAENIQRGAELTRGLAACGACHGTTSDPESPLSGGRPNQDRYGQVLAANITRDSASGIGSWKTTDVLKAIRSSIAPGERELSSAVHRGYEWLSDKDALAITTYVGSLPGVENVVARRELSTIDRNTTGFFDSRKSASGFIPSIEPRHEIQYGKYLVDHVARCTRCHNLPATFVNGQGYLVGGLEIDGPQGKKLTPDITGNKVSGLADWSEAQVVNYLRTGSTPDGAQVSPDYCPTNFYRNATEVDLARIASYLKTIK